MQTLPVFSDSIKSKFLGHNVKFISKRVVHRVTAINLKCEAQEKVVLYRFLCLNYVYLFTFSHTYKVESVIGFITPFDGLQYVAGLDKDVLYNIPLNAKIDVDIRNKNLSLTLTPMNDNRVRMVQTLARPYTSIHNFFDVVPIVESKHTKMIKSRPIKQVRSSI
jgi:hypothetical protein